MSSRCGTDVFRPIGPWVAREANPDTICGLCERVLTTEGTRPPMHSPTCEGTWLRLGRMRRPAPAAGAGSPGTATHRTTGQGTS